MKAYKCPKCGHLHTYYTSFIPAWCFKCDFTPNKGKTKFELVEIIDWKKELTKTEEKWKRLRHLKKY